MLSEKELIDLNLYAKRASLGQLVGLVGLFQAYLDENVRGEQESLALLLGKEEGKVERK